MTDALPIVSEHLPKAGPLACVSCGYDLRDLPIEGNCPECGTPIARSLHGEKLSSADPRWLNALAGGQTLIAWGITIALTAVLFRFVAPILLVILNAMLGVSFGVDPDLAGQAALGVAIVFLLAAAAGVMIVTMQDPRESERESPTSARRVARWAMGATAVSAAALVMNVTFSAGTLEIVLSAVIGLLFAAALTVGIVAMLTWLLALARRIPHETLIKKTSEQIGFLRWAIPVLSAMLVLGASPLWKVGLGWALGTMWCASVIIGFVLWAYIMALPKLMFNYREAFQACARQPADIISAS